MLRPALAILLALSVTACALGTTNLTLTAPEGRTGVISEAPPTTLDVPAVEDRRANTERIGDKRNGYGQVMGAVGSTQAPAEQVEQALEQVLAANNHVLGDADDRYALQATLNTFWLDTKVGLVTVEFFGTIEADVALVDRVSGEALYTEAFQGYFSERNAGGLSATWTRILNAAFEDFATKVSMSDGLRDALAATHVVEPAAAEDASS
jgi:hypothetical protein